jgi:hypothetical protein
VLPPLPNPLLPPPLPNPPLPLPLLLAPPSAPPPGPVPSSPSWLLPPLEPQLAHQMTAATVAMNATLATERCFCST